MSDDRTATDTTVLEVLRNFAAASWTTNFVAEPRRGDHFAVIGRPT